MRRERESNIPQLYDDIPGEEAIPSEGNYCPRVPVVKLLLEHAPRLSTVTGDAMPMHGVNDVDYTVSKTYRLTAIYDAAKLKYHYFIIANRLHLNIIKEM